MTSKQLIFLPGTLCDQAVFSSQIEALNSAGFSTQCIDFGTADSLSEMAEKAEHVMATQRSVLVAFSMGGMVAFEILRREKVHVDALILIASNAHPDLPGRAALRAEHLSQAKQSGLINLITDTYMPNYLYSQQSAYQECILTMAERLGESVFEAQLSVLELRPDSSELLSQIALPTLIIGGNNDPLCPVAEQQRMASLISTHSLVLLDNCGHFVTLEQPHKVNELILDWLGPIAP